MLPDYPVNSTRRTGKATGSRASDDRLPECLPFAFRSVDGIGGHGARAPLPTKRAACYAARTLARNSSTALRSMPDWLSSSRALTAPRMAALPVAAAAVVTPPIWALISLDPAATDWMLRAISRVASPCCSIDGRDADA